MNLGKKLIVLGTIMISVGFIGIIHRNATAKKYYHVEDENGNFYITNYIHYIGDCIVFYDNEYDMEHRVCGNYKVEKI